MKDNVITAMTAEGMETAKQDCGITKPYRFRKLNSTDVFLMFKILGKIGINEFTSDSFKDLIGASKKGEDASTAIGISIILEVANLVMSNIHKCEADIYQILANTSNLSVKQIKELDMVTFAEMVIDFIKKDEFLDFFKAVSRLFKSAN